MKMASNIYHQEPSAPLMYPEIGGNDPPLPPVRLEFQQQAHNRILLPPEAPPRMDQPPSRSHTNSGLRRDDNEETMDDTDNEGTCNYNRYATTKTIGHALLEFALIISNAMQLRILILQKQHDGIWIASLILVCVSILSLIGLAFILYIMIKGDIRNPNQHIRLERFNTLAFFLTVFISIINVIINVFMLTINPKSFLDARSLELLHPT